MKDNSRSSLRGDCNDRTPHTSFDWKVVDSVRSRLEENYDCQHLMRKKVAGVAAALLASPWCLADV